VRIEPRRYDVGAVIVKRIRMLVLQPFACTIHPVHEVISIIRMHSTHDDVIVLCFFDFIIIAKLRHQRNNEFAVGSGNLLIAIGFILLGEIRENMQRGLMQFLHLTTPRRSFAYINLCCPVHMSLALDHEVYYSLWLGSFPAFLISTKVGSWQ
jgi:hypothetical protein